MKLKFCFFRPELSQNETDFFKQKGKKRGHCLEVASEINKDEWTESYFFTVFASL